MAEVKGNNWQDYQGWSEFELRSVWPNYFREIDPKHGMNIASLGCGDGTLEKIMIDSSAANIIGFEGNLESAQRAIQNGVPTFHMDVYNIRKFSGFRGMFDVVCASFLVSNTDPNRIEELFRVFEYLKKEDGKVVLVDPEPNTEHITSNDPHTFRRIKTLEGEYLDPKEVDPEKDDYMIEIHLNSGLKNETIINQRHIPESAYQRGYEVFNNVNPGDIGFQTSTDGIIFEAYRLTVCK